MKIGVETITITTLFLLCLPILTLGQGRDCTVTDPTGTPLNIRDAPNGRVIGALRNGKEVYIEELTLDASGRSWAKVSDSNRKIIGWVFREFISCDSHQALKFQKQDGPTSLIAAIAKKYSGSARYSYSLIQIGATQYLVRDGKILQTRKANNKIGGICGSYANVRVVLSDRQMHERSEGEGSIWKLGGGQWKEIIHSSAGDWKCDDVRQLPNTARKCLDADTCF